MKRHVLALFSVLLMAGCATTRSNYYGHEGRGDYYYGSNAADVVMDSSPYVYGFGGFGYGYAYGYPYYWGDSGYPPIWWKPSQPHDDPGSLRGARVADDRASRSALIRRDTVQAPDSAKRFRDLSGFPRPIDSARMNTGAPARATDSASRSRAIMRNNATPSRTAPAIQSRPPASRPVSVQMPARSASTTRKQ